MILSLLHVLIWLVLSKVALLLEGTDLRISVILNGINVRAEKRNRKFTFSLSIAQIIGFLTTCIGDIN